MKNTILENNITFVTMEETQRQKRIASIIQRDLVDVLQNAVTQSHMRGTIISVSRVKITVDLSIAKVYVSIFPTDKTKVLFEGIVSNTHSIKHELAQRTKHQLRRMPSLEFFIDDSLDYIENIETSLKGEENPIKNPDILEKRKKR